MVSSQDVVEEDGEGKEEDVDDDESTLLSSSEVDKDASIVAASSAVDTDANV